MPLFTDKFSPKKTQIRKSLSLNNLSRLDHVVRETEYGMEYGTASVKLGGQELVFDNGSWIAEGGSGVNQRDYNKLKKQTHSLSEENNLLKLKIDILLDMLAESSAESDQPNKEHELRMAHRGNGGRK